VKPVDIYYGFTPGAEISGREKPSGGVVFVFGAMEPERLCYYGFTR
jgi:hypothetical protein